jgi:hypothetical protein
LKVIAKRGLRMSSRERTQNRRIDQSLMDLVNTVATDLDKNDPITTPAGASCAGSLQLLVPETAVSRDGVLVGLPVPPKDPTPGSRVDLRECTGHERPGALDPPPTTNRKPRERLLKMSVWFTQDDTILVQKIATARGQNAADFIQGATIKLLAELGAVDGERRRLLLLFR